MRLEPWHVILLVIVVLLVFGANRLPSVAKSLGQSLKIFRNEMKDLNGSDKPADPHQDEGDGSAPKA